MALNDGAIKLEDILNIEGINDPSYQKLLDWLESTNQNLDEFIEKLKSAPVNQFGKDTENLINKMRSLSEETQKANQATKEGTEFITKALGQVELYAAGLEKIKDTKKSLTDAEKKFLEVYQQLVDNIKNGIAVLSDEKNAINANEKARELLKNQVVQNIETLVNFQKEIKILTRDIDIHSESNKVLSRYLKSLQSDYNNLEQQVKRTDKENQELLETIQQLNVQLKAEKQNLSGANTQIGILNDLTQKLEKSISKLATTQSTENAELIENNLLIKKQNKEIEDNIKLRDAEAGSIAKMKFRLGELTAQWSLMGKESRKANQDVRMEMVALEKELARVQEASKKTNFELTTVGKMWHSLKTFAIMSPGFFVFGAVYAGFQKLYELFDLGTKRTQEARKELEQYAEKIKDIGSGAFGDANKEKAHADILLNTAKDVNLVYTTRIDAIRELRKEYKNLFKDYTDEEIMAGKAFEAEKKLTEVIFMRASVKGNEKKIAASSERVSDAQQKIDEAKMALSIMNDPNKILYKSARTPEENLFLEKQRSRSTTDKIFRTSKSEYKDIIRDNENIIKDETAAVQVYLKRGNSITKSLNELNNEKEDIDKARAKLKEVQDAMESLDLQLYGIDINKSTAKDVYNNKKLSKDKEGFLKEEIRLKDLIAALEGRKAPSGRVGKNKFSEEMRLQEEIYQDKLSGVQSKYDNNAPNNTFDDDINLTKTKVDLAEENYKKKLSIIEKYHNSRYQDELQYQANLKDVKDKSQDVENRQTEVSNKIEEDRRKRYDDAIKQIDDYNDRLRKSSEEIQNLLTKVALSRAKNKSDVSKVGHVNPLFSALGLEDNVFNFDQNMAALDSQINERNALLNKYKEDRVNLKGRQLGNSAQLDTLGYDIKGNSIGEKLSNDKRGIFTLKYKETQEDAAQVADLDKKILNEGLSIEQLNNQKKIDLAQREADAKKELYQQTFNFSEQIANQGFKNQQNRINYQIEMLQKQSDFEMGLAGNNALAKHRIAQREAREMAQLKRKQAESEKSQAVFQALVSAFANIAKTLSQYPLPLGAPILAINTAQSFAAVASIASTKIPQYWKGKKRGEGSDGKARINELGTELVERNGNMFVMGGGKDSIVDIKKSDIVHTHENSIKMLQTQKFINNLSLGNELSERKKENDKKELYQYILKGMLSEESVERAFNNALRNNKPEIKIVQPARGVEERLQRQQQRNGL